jgi:hypothetical protein
MIVCLTNREIEKYADQIRPEFDRLRRLLRQRRLEVKHYTQEWDFFQHCFDVLMGDGGGDFNCTRRQAKAFKYRISWKLKKFYAARADKALARSEELRKLYPDEAARAVAHGPRKDELEPIRFIFKLEDQRQIKSLFGKNPRYPGVNGYALLVIPAVPTLNYVNQARGVLARVVDDAIHAEFDAYRRLPEDDAEFRQSLKHCFDLGGNAYAKLLDEIKRHRENREVISNPGNPSTKPHLLEIEVEELSEQSARVRTKECWNLHWLSTAENVYVRFWEGQNSQRYTLVRSGGRWLVRENEYDEPRG